MLKYLFNNITKWMAAAAVCYFTHSELLGWCAFIIVFCLSEETKSLFKNRSAAADAPDQVSPRIVQSSQVKL
jgi:hypothetical protein